MNPSTIPEPIFLDWSPISNDNQTDSEGQDAILSTTGIYTLANNTGYIDVNVQGRKIDVIKDFTDNTRFCFYIHDEPRPIEESLEYSLDDSTAEQTLPEDADDGLLTFCYTFRHGEGVIEFSSDQATPNIGFYVNPIKIWSTSSAPVLSVNGLFAIATLTVTQGSVKAAINNSVPSSANGSPGNPAVLKASGVRLGTFSLNVQGGTANQFNIYILSGSNWS